MSMSMCRVLYGVGSVRRPGRLGEWSVTVNYGLMLTSGAKTKVTTRFLVKNYPYDMFGRYSRYKDVTQLTTVTKVAAVTKVDES